MAEEYKMITSYAENRHKKNSLYTDIRLKKGSKGKKVTKIKQNGKEDAEIDFDDDDYLSFYQDTLESFELVS